MCAPAPTPTRSDGRLDSSGAEPDRRLFKWIARGIGIKGKMRDWGPRGGAPECVSGFHEFLAEHDARGCQEVTEESNIQQAVIPRLDPQYIAAESYREAANTTKYLEEWRADSVVESG